jgi:hypothetical protein
MDYEIRMFDCSVPVRQGPVPQRKNLALSWLQNAEWQIFQKELFLLAK